MKKPGFYLLLALPFLILIFVFNFPAPPWPDAIVYDFVARDALKTGLFRYLIWGDFGPTWLRTNFTVLPLYPAIHVLFIKIFGSTDFRLMTGFNYLLAFLTFLNIGKILRLESRQKLLLLILAFNPLVYHYTSIVRPEWPNVFLFSWIWRLLAADETRVSVKTGIVTGLLLALAALNHHFAIFFVPCIIYAVWRREDAWSRRFAITGVVFLSAAVFFSPYLYYAGANFADFKLQLFGNLMEESAANGWFKFIKSFFVPLFHPSIGVFTQSGRIARWQADLVPVAVILCIASMIVKWRKKIPLSPITIEAFFFWLFLNLGCAVTTYNPYVTVSTSVLAIALLRDIFPEISPRFVKILAASLVMAVLYQLWFYNDVTTKLFRADDYLKATQCIADQIPRNETIYVMAYPDPSVELNNLRGDIDVRRYIDFAKYADIWKELVPKRRFFVISADRYNLNRYDYHSTLRNEFAEGKLTEHVCEYGEIKYMLWVRK